MPAYIAGDDLEVLRNLGDLEFPIFGAGSEPVDQQEGFALARDLVIDLDISNALKRQKSPRAQVRY